MSWLEAIGVDYAQWKALSIAALKTDLRVTSLGSAAGGGSRDRRAAVLGLIVFYLAMGAFAAALVVALRDVLLSSTLVLTYVMFMVGAMVLMDHNSVITSPDDYSVLGFRPVSSRTYFAVRLTNVFVYTLVLTSAFSLLPIAAFSLAHGWRIGAAAVVAFYLSTAFTTLALVLMYAWMLRAVGANRLKRALSYLQLVMGFLVYGGYFLMSQLTDRQTIDALALPDTPWLRVLPPTWFASFLAVAGGRVEPSTVLPAAAAIVAIVALSASLGGRLSLGYAEQLGALTSATSAAAPRSARRRRPLWFRTGEARAVALLVRAQFRNDQKFRMAVLGVLPLTILYVFMSRRHGPLPDPFTMNWRSAGNTMLITVAILTFPTTLRLSLSRSDWYKASWIYFTSPADRSRLVFATKNVLVALFLLPYLAFVAAFLIVLIGAPVHVLIHMAFMGLFSHLMLQAAVFVDPALPFSQPLQKGSRSGMLFVTMMAVFAFAVVLVPLLAAFVYVSAWRIAALAAAIVLSSAAITRLTRARIERLAREMEFVG